MIFLHGLKTTHNVCSTFLRFPLHLPNYLLAALASCERNVNSPFQEVLGIPTEGSPFLNNKAVIQACVRPVMLLSHCGQRSTRLMRTSAPSANGHFPTRTFVDDPLAD